MNYIRILAHTQGALFLKKKMTDFIDLILESSNEILPRELKLATLQRPAYFLQAFFDCFYF